MYYKQFISNKHVTLQFTFSNMILYIYQPLRDQFWSLIFLFKVFVCQIESLRDQIVAHRPNYRYTIKLSLRDQTIAARQTYSTCLQYSLFVVFLFFIVAAARPVLDAQIFVQSFCLSNFVTHLKTHVACSQYYFICFKFIYFL